MPADLTGRLRRFWSPRPASDSTEERVGALPWDLATALPLPFVCQDEAGRGTLRELVTARVTQCALSRICAMCGQSLDAPPLVLLGTRREEGRNAFSVPPMHAGCADHAHAAYTGLDDPVLGHESGEEWVLVRTGGFDLERPHDREAGSRPLFVPNAILPAP
ncbi:MAG: hypothetical protein Q8Q02_08565 [Nocardioides sp.]|nr:hypothetical protein [Nocardioides sp.]